MDLVRLIATGLKKAKKCQKSVFGQNGGQNYFWFLFHFRFAFYALDFVENEYNIEGVRQTLFEIFGAKV